MIRVGESWQARNGHRRWVSMPLRDLLALGFLGLVFFGPFWLLWRLVLAEVWLAAECAVFLVTGIMVLAVVAMKQARFGDVTVTRLRWGLWMVDLKGRRP